MPAEFTCEQVQERYPNPMQASATDSSKTIEETYCVMGACCAYSGRPNLRFPTFRESKEILMEVNPALDRDNADRYAVAIQSQNDRANFGKAWGLLCEALLV
jgi:hypothetical protein